MVEAQVGVAILPGSAARRHAQTMAIDTVALSDDWALRQMQICVRSLPALPLFARDLVDLLVEDAQAAEAAKAAA
jgi:DNA-binding transcriptional LysR family regulator